MQTFTNRLGQFALALASLGLPLFLLLTSWILDRWPASAFDTIAIGAAGVLLICMATRPFNLEVHWSLAAPLIAGTIGLFQIRSGTSVNPNATLLSSLDWFGLAALYFLAQQFFAIDRRLSRYFPATAMTFSTLYAVYAVVQWFTSQGRIFWKYPNAVGLERVLGTLLNRNHYSAYIELFLPAVFWYFLESPSGNPHAAIATGVLFASVVASASRGGFAVVVFELVVIFLLRRYWDARAERRTAWDAGEKSDRRSEGSRETSSLFVAAAVGAVILFTAAIGVEPLKQRVFGPKVSEFLADYGQSRWEYVEASIQMIKARPALGFGLGTWPEIYPAYGSFDAPDTHVNHAHNDPVEWLSEGGVLFLIPIAILIAACVRIGFEQPWALGPAAVMIHSLVDFPLQKMAIFSTLLLILAGGCDRSRRRDP